MKSGPAKAITVMVVDDHLSFSEALGIAIDTQEGMTFAGAAPSLAAALPLIVERSPDVVLVDVHLPDADGIEAIPQIKGVSASAKILVITGDSDPSLLAAAAAVGAAGFLFKGSPISHVIRAIRSAGEGGLLLDAETLDDVLSHLRESQARKDVTVAPHLTEREQEVLRLLSEGLDPASIGRELHISTHTARSHVKSILMKLGVHTQLEAVVTAARNGLIPGLGQP